MNRIIFFIQIIRNNLINHFMIFWIPQPQTSVLKVLSKFLKEHKIDLEGALRQQDKDHSGSLQHEEVKLAFKEAGLRLTNVRLCLNKIMFWYFFYHEHSFRFELNFLTTVTYKPTHKVNFALKNVKYLI